MNYIDNIPVKEKKTIEQLIDSKNIIKKELEALAWSELVEEKKIDKTHQAKLQAKHDALETAINERTKPYIEAELSSDSAGNED